MPEWIKQAFIIILTFPLAYLLALHYAPVAGLVITVLALTLRWYVLRVRKWEAYSGLE